MGNGKNWRNVAILAAAFALMALPAEAAKPFAVVHAFHGGEGGATPHSGVLRDAAGNLYGTTFGGAFGYGSVFKISANNANTTLYSFKGGSDGQAPLGRLVADASGNLYGTTFLGGVSASYGTVFKVTPDGTKTALHVFTGGANDGATPAGGVIIDAAGNLYGTTSYGAGTGCPQGSGCGVIFEIAPDGSETLLHVFGGQGDGYYPAAGLLADSAGNLYGTTSGGGAHDFGVVFKLAPDGTETVLHSFAGSDGANPYASLIMDDAGNLFGTTQFGGLKRCGCGTVFELAPDGTTTVLHAFKGGADGNGPVAGLTTDGQGNLYGTTYFGGSTTGCYPQRGCGTVFKVTLDGSKKILYRFADDNSNPDSSFVLDGGYLYGTTTQGTVDAGSVFKIRK